MEPCVINAMGVGEHAASWIEAEEFSSLSGPGGKVDLLAHGGGIGFAVSFHLGTKVGYTAVRDWPKSPTLVLRVARGEAVGDAAISISARNQTDSVGTCAVSFTGSWSTFTTVRCPLTAFNVGYSTVELLLTATSSSGATTPHSEIVRIDSFGVVDS